MIGHDKAKTIAELNQAIRGHLEGAFFGVQVIGEISNFTKHSSGHTYFTLKDETAQIAAVMFREDYRRANCPLKGGMQVKATGTVTLYARSGRCQIVLRKVEPVGKGALEQAFRELKDKLSKEGLFEKKNPLPPCPQKVGIITSPTGAAIRDILNVSRRRFPLTDVYVYSAQVQGENAHKTIIKGLEYFKDFQVDVIILGRGGGSLEDLWPFNEEELARAIYTMSTPIVSAVGHEIDFSISDFVADVRAATPSAAAELVFPDKEDYLRRIKWYQKSLNETMYDIIKTKKQIIQARGYQGQIKREVLKVFEDAGQRIDMAQNALQMTMDQRIKTMLSIVEKYKQILQKRDMKTSWLLQKKRYFYAKERMETLVLELMAQKKEKLRHLLRELNLLGPEKTLERGYAIVRRKEGGAVIKKVSDVAICDTLSIRLQDGTIQTQVEGIDKDNLKT